MKQGTLEEAATIEGLYRCSQHNFNQAEAGYNAKWFKRGALFGAKWQIDRQDIFAIGFAEWSVARALGCDSFTINQDELSVYKKYIDTLNGN
jgi:hypothetical protein